MNHFILLLMACGQSCSSLRRPTLYSLETNVPVRVPGLDAQVSAHGGVSHESSHLGSPPSRVVLRFVRGQEEQVRYVEQEQPKEIWGHSFVVLGHEMDSLWICPAGWAADSEGCVAPAPAN